jgi:hypothetical protein
MEKIMSDNNNAQLPSPHQMETEGAVNFYQAGKLENCTINKIHFGNGGFISYDFKVRTYQDEKGNVHYSRLLNIPWSLFEPYEK